MAHSSEAEVLEAAKELCADEGLRWRNDDQIRTKSGRRAAVLDDSGRTEYLRRARQMLLMKEYSTIGRPTGAVEYSQGGEVGKG